MFLKIQFGPVNKYNWYKTHEAITPVMGKALWRVNKPTMADANSPTPICRAPINAEALPACLVNGAMDKADELGKLKLWQPRYTNIHWRRATALCPFVTNLFK
jgi:hypothetical protein